MGFRFQRRIKMGKGLGLNVSRSGFSLSQHTRWGTFGTRGVSIRTGISGLSLRFGRRSGGGLVALVVALVQLSVYGLIAAFYVGAWLLWFGAVAVYWLTVGTVLAGRWIALTVYDLAVYLASRRMPETRSSFDASGDTTNELAAQTGPDVVQAWTPVALPGAAADVDYEAERPRWREKLLNAHGPAARRAVVERALRALPRPQHERFLLDASEVGVQAALAKAQGLKSVAARRRVLLEAMEFLRADAVPDDLQGMQLRWLEEALAALEAEAPAGNGTPRSSKRPERVSSDEGGTPDGGT